MSISYHRESAFSTNCPKLRECIAMQNTDASAVGFRIKFVVENGLLHFQTTTVLLPEKKDA